MEDFILQMRNDHRQFDQGKLEDFVGHEPFHLLAQWLREAIEKPTNEPNAMIVATVDEKGIPRSRVVYWKELLEEGIVFYTNYNSEKGKALEVNPQVHALLFWPEMERQISISGLATKIPAEMSDAYFDSRPRGSQVGAWASLQSERLEKRQDLEDRVEQFAAQFPTQVPRPEHWGGYLISIDNIEFWQGRPSRLHDRITFQKKEDGTWEIYRKHP